MREIQRGTERTKERDRENKRERQRNKTEMHKERETVSDQNMVLNLLRYHYTETNKYMF